MTSERKRLLNELLIEVATQSEGKSPEEPEGRSPGFIPRVCLKSFYKLTRTPFMELIIWRAAAGGKIEYLYQNRHDEWWFGHCAFGGAIRGNYPPTMVGLAQKLIDREFRDMGIKVTTLQIVSALNWPVHPWANPFAIACLIQVEGEIPVGGDRVWISTDNLPERMVMNHGPYLRQCDYFLESGEPLTFTRDIPFGVPGLNPPFEEYVPPPPLPLASES